MNNNSIELRRSIHLGRKLGEGGMGRVLDGLAPDLGQYLAVKVLRKEHADDREMSERFDEEVAIMASIDHPGNLPVYGTTKDPDGNPCYVMKKVEGRTLTKLLAERGDAIEDLPLRHRLLAVLMNACETMACAHAGGVVHRDLKPDNILIDSGGSTYVIDWGIAKRRGPDGDAPQAGRTLAGIVMGTPGYMSPEQADGRAETAGPQADVFALGVILYEILTGRRPFGDDGGRAEMLAVVHRDPESPRRANLLLPRSISEVCLKALAKDPARRYPDARGLADDIRAHLEGRAVSAVRPNLVERTRYAARRRPMRALTIGSLLFAALVLAAFIIDQVWIDHRLADKALDRIEELDLEIVDLNREITELDRQIAELKPSDQADDERKRLQSELAELESRWLLHEFEAMRMLSSVGELRFIRSDAQIEALARRRLYLLVKRTFEYEKPIFGLAVLKTLLERHEEGRLTIGLSPADVEEVRRLIKEGQQLAGLPSP